MIDNKTKKHKSKYITAQQAAYIYGVSAKSLLNRTLLSTSDPRYIPFLNLKGGRRKYFERKVIDRMFQVRRVSK